MESKKNCRGLIKPENLTVLSESGEDVRRYAKIVLSPLERGFGLTLGNAMRRILLSSVPGFAISSVKIEGVLHEYSTIQGVQEDMTDILLNLKSIPVKMYSTNKKSLRFKVTGPMAVMSGMIGSNSSVQILDPNILICTISTDRELEMELMCERGRGYVQAVRDPTMPIGTIPIDCLFSPVLSVTYHVENTRIKQVTDYDKLVMYVRTNGVVTPEEAVICAASILQEQLSVFSSLEAPSVDLLKSKEFGGYYRALCAKIEVLTLSTRAMGCLQGQNVVYIGDLVRYSDKDLLKIQHFGSKTLREVEDALAELDLRLGMDVEWPPENLHEISKEDKNFVVD
ncbi:DNA-directed RNA polymerase subunit alpha [Rickettsiales endosymbiont of Paramecium tredecaurelia]|uniref:DNA-directed RNA polymerase subunit alpha n=1 Tax=Candidatus Sarmatiella mevalonica TaxID=2770581 RepID=UPI00192379F7|nr:DNA-directed RNA polymerase subunit alpha [Candidatus Sarmatiella mevalonica]MBL3284794.1 DNA-directed RNA polymerase subunit alpha [Candidatus Sarmatiella mevalonica]